MVLFASVLGACNAEDEPTNQDAAHSHANDCEDRGEPIELGMTKLTNGGLYDVVLLDASPIPPLIGENNWTVEVTTVAGEPAIDDPDVLDDTIVIINVNMADHNHNLRKKAAMTSPGVFEFPPLTVTMPGYWEFTVVVAPEASTDPNEHDDALFGICVPSD